MTEDGFLEREASFVDVDVIVDVDFDVDVDVDVEPFVSPGGDDNSSFVSSIIFQSPH